LICSEQGVSIRADRGNHVRHEEAVVHQKGNQTQACVETCNTGTLRQSMHLDRETSRSHWDSLSLRLYLCLATQMYWTPTVPGA